MYSDRRGTYKNHPG